MRAEIENARAAKHDTELAEVAAIYRDAIAVAASDRT
jgi:hypothetical protein